MKKILLYTFSVMFSMMTVHAQDFAPKRVLIEDLGATIGSDDVQNGEDVVYTVELNEQLHFISHIEGTLVLYRLEGDDAIEVGNIGELAGFIVDIVDHNSDDLSDILGHFQVKFGESETEFSEESSVATEALEGRIYRAGDYDLDGIVDIMTRDVSFVAGSFTETVYVYYLNSDQSIKSTASFFTDEELIGAAAFDLNQDGQFDFVYTQDFFGDNRLVIQMSNGDGTFTEQNIGVNNTESLILADDFDGDSDLDIIITGFNGSDIEILTNDAGVFSSDERVVDTGRIFSIVNDDINSDDNIDLIYLENNDFEFLDVNIALGNGDGTFGDTRTIGQVQFGGVRFTNSFEQATEDWLNVFDYNEDGRPDIFVNAILEQSFVVFENLRSVSSVDELEEPNVITAYPNPTSGLVYLENIDLPQQIELLDVNGVVHAIQTDNNQINTATLNSGIYLLKMTTDKNTQSVVKIVKE